MVRLLDNLMDYKIFYITAEQAMFIAEAVNKIGSNDFWMRENTECFSANLRKSNDSTNIKILVPELVHYDDIVSVWNRFFTEEEMPCLIIYIVLNIFNERFIKEYEQLTNKAEEEDEDYQQMAAELLYAEAYQNNIRHQIQSMYNALCKLDYPAKIIIGKSEIEIGDWLPRLIEAKGKKLIQSFREETLGGRPSPYAYRMAGKLSALLTDKTFWSKAGISIKTTGRGNKTNEFIAEILSVAGYCEKELFNSESSPVPYSRVTDAKKAWNNKQAFCGRWESVSSEDLQCIGLSDEEFIRRLIN